MKKIILILPILISIVLLGCRKQEYEPPAEHQLRQGVKDWGYFEKGSYWVFQNDSTLRLDTLRVTEVDTIETGYKIPTSGFSDPTDVYNGFHIQLKDSLSIYSIFLNFSGWDRYEEKEYFTEQMFLRAYLYEKNELERRQLVFSNSFMLLSWDQKLKNYKFSNKKRSPWIEGYMPYNMEPYFFESQIEFYPYEELNIYEIMEVLDSYTLNEKTYNDVYHIKAYSLNKEEGYDYGYNISDFWIAKNVGIIKKVFRTEGETILSQSLIDHKVYQ